jgi:hypothetical protein
MIYDDFLKLFYDVHVIFVTTFQGKSWSLLSYDDTEHFVIERYHSMTKVDSVTSKSSLMFTFLVVLVSEGAKNLIIGMEFELSIKIKIKR